MSLDLAERRKALRQLLAKAGAQLEMGLGEEYGPGLRDTLRTGAKMMHAGGRIVKSDVSPARRWNPRCSR